MSSGCKDPSMLTFAVPGGATKGQVGRRLLDQALLHHRSKHLHLSNIGLMVAARILVGDSFAVNDSVRFTGNVQV